MSTNQIIKQAQEEIGDILVFAGKYKPTPAELERWQEKHRREYIVKRLRKLFNDAITQAVEEERKNSEKDIRYYAEKYEFNRLKAFQEFIKMLNTVLVSKTNPNLIQAIVEDVVGEFNKIYDPKS